MNTMELPIITRANPRKVKEFYKQLRFKVQSLNTLERLADVKGNVRCTLGKLKGIKAICCAEMKVGRTGVFKIF